VCLIGLTGDPLDPHVTLQRCLTAGHQTFSTLLFKQVPCSAWVSLLTEGHWESRSQLTVGGDVSTSVTLTRLPTG